MSKNSKELSKLVGPDFAERMLVEVGRLNKQAVLQINLGRKISAKYVSEWCNRMREELTR